MQTRNNLLNREEEQEMLPLCADQGVGVPPYSPLAGGLLAGRRDTPRAIAEQADGSQRIDDNDTDVIDALSTVAAGHIRPAAQIALAWLLGKTPVSAPIVGVTKPYHLGDALAALDLALSKEDIARLEARYRPTHRTATHSPPPPPRSDPPFTS